MIQEGHIKILSELFSFPISSMFRWMDTKLTNSHGAYSRHRINKRQYKQLYQNKNYGLTESFTNNCLCIHITISKIRKWRLDSVLASDKISPEKTETQFSQHSRQKHDHWSNTLISKKNHCLNSTFWIQFLPGSWVCQRPFKLLCRPCVN